MRDSSGRILSALDIVFLWRFHLPVLIAVACLLIFPPRIQDETFAAVVSVLIVLAGVGIGLGWQWSALKRKPKA